MKIKKINYFALTVLLIVVVILLNNRKQNEYELDNDVAEDYKISKELEESKHILFDNKKRIRNSMPPLDSLAFNFTNFRKGDSSYLFSSIKSKKNTVFQTRYSPKNKMVHDYFLLGNDSVFRIQRQYMDNEYTNSLTVGALITSEKSKLIIRGEDVIKFAKEHKLVSDTSTYFYGLYLDYEVIGNPDKFEL